MAPPINKPRLDGIRIFGNVGAMVTPEVLCRALEGEGVELVEVGGPGGRHHADLTALGRGGVDVVKVGEARRVLDVAKLAVGVHSPNGHRHAGHHRQQATSPNPNRVSWHATILPIFSRS